MARFIRTKDNRILSKDYCNILYGMDWVGKNTVSESDEIKDLCDAFVVKFSSISKEPRYFTSLNDTLKFYSKINQKQFPSKIFGVINIGNNENVVVVEFFGDGSPEILDSELRASLLKDAHKTKLNENMIPVKEELYDYLVKNVIKQVFEVDGKYYISIYDNSPWLFATEIDKEHYESLKENGVKEN